MKKILSFLAAGVLALGLIGCSGDLHDDVKSSGGSGEAGSWYYISAGTPSGAPTIIFNNDDGQTANTPLSVTSGKVFFKIDTTKVVEEEDYGSIRKRWGCDQLTESEAKDLGWEDKGLSGLGIYCYAAFDPLSTGLKIYSHTPECFGSWSGKPMSNDGAKLEKFNINLSFKFDVSSYEATTGKKVGTVFITGEKYTWQYPVNFGGWSDGKVTENQFCVPSSETTLSYSIEAAEFPAETGQLQLVLFETGVDAKQANADAKLLQTGNFKSPLQDSSETPYADFQNTRYKHGATIPVLITVAADGKATAEIK